MSIRKSGSRMGDGHLSRCTAGGEAMSLQSGCCSAEMRFFYYSPVPHDARFGTDMRFIHEYQYRLYNQRLVSRFQVRHALGQNTYNNANLKDLRSRDSGLNEGVNEHPTLCISFPLNPLFNLLSVSMGDSHLFTDRLPARFMCAPSEERQMLVGGP